MFDELMSGVNHLITETEEKILNARKNLEKQMIRHWVAPQVYSSSEDRKLVTRQTEKRYVKRAKNKNQAFIKQLSSSAKGNWVNIAKVTLQESTEILQII